MALLLILCIISVSLVLGNLYNYMNFILLPQFYDNKWCNPTLYGPDHTMCLYETKLKSDKCGEVKEHGVISQVVI